MRRLIPTLLSLGIAFTAGWLAREGAAADSSPSAFQNPINSGPDPWMVWHEGNYYLSTSQGDAIRVWKAPTLGGLKTANAVTVWRDDDPARSRSMWAPEMHWISNRWYLYYTATSRDNNDDNHRMHVLESAGTDPLGPYAYKARLFNPTNDHYAIDGSVFQHSATGAWYFVWAARPGHVLYIARMANPWTLEGNGVYLPASGFGCDEVREGPVCLQRNDRLFLVYSACDTGKPDYKLGMLIADDSADLLDPRSWRQYPRPVFERSDANGVFGPGHNGFFRSPDGTEDWIVYHAKTTARYTYRGRTTRAQKFAWNADGTPDFGVPVAAGVSLAEPSSRRAAGQVITWPAPEGEVLSTNYQVTVEGRPVPVYVARSAHGGDYAFALFDFTGAVQVEVLSPGDLSAARIRPESAGVPFRAGAHKVSFTLDRPRKISIEPDGIQSPLLLFAGAPETKPCGPGDPNVVYFGPGIHKPGRIVLKAGQTLYLAGGAVVKGAIVAEHADGLRICGRGILDGTDWPRLKGPAPHMVRVQDSRDVTVEDIVIRGSFAWTVVPMRCRDVVIRNLKLVNSRVENDDGINPCNSENVLIEDCFVRTDDDCVALKGMAHLNSPPAPVRGITVRRCVFWCDRARIFLLGHESQASAMEDLLYQDCDIVHYRMTPFLLEPGEEMPLRRAKFENIRIEGEGQPDFITLRPTVNQYMKVKSPGTIRDVTFRNIVLAGKKQGPARILIQGADAAHNVVNVTLENVSRYGHLLETNSANFVAGPFAEVQARASNPSR